MTKFTKKEKGLLEIVVPYYRKVAMTSIEKEITDIIVKKAKLVAKNIVKDYDIDNMIAETIDFDDKIVLILKLQKKGDKK